MSQAKILLGFCVAAAAHAAPEWAVPDLSKSDEARLSAFLSELEATLPPLMRQSLDKTELRIDFKLAAEGPLVAPPQPGYNPDSSQKDDRYGHYSALTKTISLHPEMLTAILNQDESPFYNWGHRTRFGLARATLIHEFTHAYENSLPQKISDDPVFRNLAGWKPDTATGKADQVRLNLGNLHLRQSPDNYEYASPKEALAVNMEYFISDPDYRCRRPSLYAYLSQRLGYEPHADSPCTINTKVPYVSPLTTGYLNLDPARVFEIQSMLVDSGDSFLTSNGHILERLVVCAPERKVVGPECREDFNYHVSVGYGAVTPARPNPLATVIGKFPGQELIAPASITFDRYNSRELRGLVGETWNLNDDQKSKVIYHMLENFWSFEAKYELLSNNCATLMSRAIGASLGLPLISSKISPRNMQRDLAKRGLIEAEPQNTDLVSEGFKFPSHVQDLSDGFNKILGASWQNQLGQYSDLREFLLKASADEVLHLAGEILQSKSVDPDVARFYAQDLAVTVLQLRSDDYAKSGTGRLAKICSKSAPGDLSSVCASFAEIKQLNDQVNPLNWVQDPQSYGIPLASEVRMPSQETLQRYRALISSVPQLLQSAEDSKLQSERLQIEQLNAALKSWLTSRPQMNGSTQWGSLR